jgi:hypothetical protein
MLDGQGGFLGHEMPAKKKTEESCLKNKIKHNSVGKYKFYKTVTGEIRCSKHLRRMMFKLFILAFHQGTYVGQGPSHFRVR